jgi:hypothetical protein
MHSFTSNAPLNVEDLRARLRKMSDPELLRFGQAAKELCRPGNNNPNFLLQLDEARVEWKRRHPRLPLSESI